MNFIDLFCGIGGFHYALKKHNLSCVFSADSNHHACEVYQKNYNISCFCDLTKITNESILDIPNFDILCAGFPCQAFSIAGKQKGFDDARGTLFFEICRFISIKKPKVIILENVKNLLYHNSGQTFITIKNILENFNYFFSYKVLNANNFGLPQNRERIIIVASLIKKFDFNSLPLSQEKPTLDDILEKNIIHNYLNSSEYTLISNPQQQKNSGLIFYGYLNKKTRTNGVKDNTLHLSRTHRQTNRIYSHLGTHPTISSQETSGRYFIFDGIGVRKLTLLECFRLMGFPDSFIKIGPKTSLYERIGNSVCPPMIYHLFHQIHQQNLL